MPRRPGGWAGSAAAVLFVMLGAVSPAGSTPPGRDGLIAFVVHSSVVGPGYGLAVVRADGSRLRHLTRDGRDRSPAWSPDGSQLAFARAGRLYVIRADGTGLRPIAPRINRARQPAWSPDGRSIAFVRGRTIYVMRSAGDQVRQIFVRDGAFVTRPSWSPDGSWIAFGLSGEGDGGSIMIVRPTGGDARYVTDGRFGAPSLDPDVADDYEPDWSPDGMLLAFTRVVWLCGSCDQEELFSVRVDGTDPHWLTTDTSFAVQLASWSPSGGRIVAETSRGVAILTASGQFVRILDPQGTEPAWQALGRANHQP